MTDRDRTCSQMGNDAEAYRGCYAFLGARKRRLAACLVHQENTVLGFGQVASSDSGTLSGCMSGQISLYSHCIFALGSKEKKGLNM